MPFKTRQILAVCTHTIDNTIRVSTATSCFFLLFVLAANTSVLHADDDSVYPMGFYSGTFDPPTLGHLAIINQALKHVQNLTILVNRNGKKTVNASSEERMEMMRLALANLNNRVRIVTVAPEEKDVVITSTMQNLSNSLPPVQFIGEDSFQHLSPQLLSSRVWWVFARRGVLPSETIPKNVHYEWDPSNIATSSSIARNLLAEGKSVEQYLAPAVIEYIQINKLYRNGPSAAATLENTKQIVFPCSDLTAKVVRRAPPFKEKPN